jgi:hypothetical protein
MFSFAKLAESQLVSYDDTLLITDGEDSIETLFRGVYTEKLP